MRGPLWEGLLGLLHCHCVIILIPATDPDFYAEATMLLNNTLCCLCGGNTARNEAHMKGGRPCAGFSSFYQ